MSLKTKIIKFTPFEAKGVKHTHYSVAYKGRIFGFSTLRFEPADYETDKDNTLLTINCDVEVLKNTVADQLTGEVRNYIDIVPKVGLALADF